MKPIADMFRDQYPDAPPQDAYTRIEELTLIVRNGEWAKNEIQKIQEFEAVRTAFTRGVMAAERRMEKGE